MFTSNLFECTQSDLDGFRCYKCSFHTHLQTHLRNHINGDVYQKVIPYKCKNCEILTYSRLVFLRHLIGKTCILKKATIKLFDCTKASLQGFQCKSCTFQTDFLTQLKRHSQKRLVRNKRQVIYECKRCNFKTYSKLFLLKHLVSDKKVDWFSCPYCRFQSENIEDIRTHLYHLHDQHLSPLIVHNLTLIDVHQLSIQRSPNNISWHQCKYCPYKSKRKHDIKRHTIYKHSDPENNILGPSLWLQCEFCSYKTLDKCGLKKHQIRKHTSSENIIWYYCHLCSYKAKMGDNLRKHQKSKHLKPEGIILFKCTKCSFKSRNRFCLRRHERSMHVNGVIAEERGIQWFYCDQCSYKCRIKSYLKKHQKTDHRNVI